MNLVEFTDRVSAHPQRKKLKIVSQSPNVMIVDVEAFDSPSVIGTPINAIKMTELQNNIKNAIDTLSAQVVSQQGTVVTTNGNYVQTFETLDMYPIGSIYLSANSTSPASLFGGTWVQIAQGRTLFGEGTLNNITYTLNSTVDAGLPNITAYMKNKRSFMGETNNEVETSGAFSHLLTSGGNLNNLSWGGNNRYSELWFNASSSNSIYGNSSTVQPNALVVKIWQRIADQTE